MSDFVECTNCGFVLAAGSAEDPTPKRVDSCPDCEGTDFRHAGP